MLKTSNLVSVSCYISFTFELTTLRYTVLLWRQDFGPGGHVPPTNEHSKNDYPFGLQNPRRDHPSTDWSLNSSDQQ